MAASLTPDSSSWWIRIHLAPLCLLLVAGFQCYRVHTLGQTPWKGGGFGMFSTIDGKDARIIKVWLLTDRGRVPVTIPKWLEKRADECRAAPSAAGLDDLAARLAELAWVDHDREWQEVAARFESRLSCLPVNSTLLHGLPSGPQAAHPLEPADDLRPTPGRRADVEPSGRGARPTPHALAVQSVEVTLGKLRFDEPTGQLACDPLLTATARPDDQRHEARP